MSRTLTIAHLYPQSLNLYGDTGNVLVLRRRLEWRNLPFNIRAVGIGDPFPAETDLLIGGGGADAKQDEVGDDFVSRAADLAAMANDDVVMLAICGTYQLLGHEFVTHTGTHIPGVGVMDVVTTGAKNRMIGNHTIQSEWGRLVGFENHSGRTTLGSGVKPLGTTLKERGNNGMDGTEGAVYRNVFGTYLHGPVLPKSPRFADELLSRALVHAGHSSSLEPLDDTLELAAAEVAASRPR